MARKKALKKGIRIKLVRSLAGCKEKQIATVKSLGLKRIGDETIQPDNPQTRGKVAKINHLIELSEG